MERIPLLNRVGPCPMIKKRRANTRPVTWSVLRSAYFYSYLCMLACILSISACGEVGRGPEHAEQAPAAMTPTARAQASAAALPARLLIPKIGVDAFVESLGVLANGDMATPMQKPWEDVGWYNLGSHPGERGSAVIDGHLDRPGGYPAVFWRLRQLQASDVIILRDTDGKELHFHVVRVAEYAPQDAPIQDIFGNRSGSYLNLITCAGDWIPNEHQTSLRLVVYTSLN